MFKVNNLEDKMNWESFVLGFLAAWLLINSISFGILMRALFKSVKDIKRDRGKDENK